MLAYRDAQRSNDSPDPSVAADLNDVFAANWDRVYAVCYRFVGNPDRAADLAQETMLHALSRLHQFEGRARFSTWLHSIARNICLMAMRKRSELLVEDGVLDPADPGVSTLKRLQRHERETLMRDAMLEVLTPLEQEAVHLRYVERLPQERITALLELEGQTGARGLLQRCRRKLSRALRKRLDELGLGTSFIRTVP